MKAVDKYKLTRYEQETIINFNEDEKTASIYTCKKSLMKKLQQYCIDYPEQFKLTKQDDYSMWFQCPKKYVAIRKPIILSEETKERLKKSGFAKVPV